MGNSAFDFYLLLLSTIQMSQHPKVGPLSGLLAIANCARFNLNFYFILMEKMNDCRDLSATQCFFDDVHYTGVYPPITLSYSVFIKVKVFGILSHCLWNYFIENPFSEALYNSLMELMFLSTKKFRIICESSKILLVKVKLVPIEIYPNTGGGFSLLLDFKYKELIFYRE